jgi:hypothetical protein
MMKYTLIIYLIIIINNNINNEWKKIIGTPNESSIGYSMIYNILLTNNILKFEIKLNKSNNLNKFLDSRIVIRNYIIV